MSQYFLKSDIRLRKFLKETHSIVLKISSIRNEDYSEDSPVTKKNKQKKHITANFW